MEAVVRATGAIDGEALYTNNKLTPAAGFEIPADHLTKFDILRTSVGTDPELTMRTRRGTGYYNLAADYVGTVSTVRRRRVAMLSADSKKSVVTAGFSAGGRAFSTGILTIASF